MFLNIHKRILVSALALLMTLVSCKKYVEVNLSDNLLSSDKVFLEAGTANSAVDALYSYYPTRYSIQYFTFLPGISSDEMHYTGSNAEILQFEQNTVGVQNSYNESYLWTYPYQALGYINQAVDGLTSTTALTDSIKNTLLGESKFLRGWFYYNMVNVFGKIPLVVNSQALTNTALTRSDTAAVYAQIISDLTDAVSLLPANYPGSSTYRIRANKYTAAALLAKIYLYQKDYKNALAAASTVISSGLYTLSTPANAFINTSKETIFQFATTYGYSSIGANYRTSSTAATVAPPAFVVDSLLVRSFDTADLRRKAWIDSTTYNSKKYYRNYKYKLVTAAAGNEYNVLLRLSDVYLIHAEAALLSGDLSTAITDINIIRTRAGLTAFSTSSTTAATLSEIVSERNKELFGEFGQRWYDLKRWGLANTIMASRKTTWTSTAQLYPIPYNQIILNPNLTQNDGY